jgi:hypothetical protein
MKATYVVLRHEKFSLLSFLEDTAIQRIGGTMEDSDGGLSTAAVF